jgi:hypothetical protein
MKQVRIYSVEIQTLFVLERHFYCDMYFTLKCGDLICSSDVRHLSIPRSSTLLNLKRTSELNSKLFPEPKRIGVYR